MIMRILFFNVLLTILASVSYAAEREDELIGVSGRILIVDTTSPDKAFTSIQKAVDEAEPGDTVLVYSGVYKENIRFRRSGEPDNPITLRAFQGHVVSVNPGREITGAFEPVAGYENVYRVVGFTAELPEEPGIWEAASHIRLIRTSSLEECENRLGSWYLNEDSGELYIRSTGRQPAAELLYVIESKAPVFNVDVDTSHIVIEGFDVAFGAMGILIARRTSDVTVRNCRIFCNGSVGLHITGDRHLAEGNELFRNNSHGIQLRFGVNYVTVRNNLAYYNGPNNNDKTAVPETTDIGIYSRGNYVLFEDNVMDGLHRYAYRNKMGNNPSNVFRRNVVRGHFKSGPYAVANNTLIVNNIGMRLGMYMNRVNPEFDGNIEDVDPDGMQRLTYIIYPALDREDPRFCDPAYRDFRLQLDSPYLGKGAHPGFTPVLYVDPLSGCDEELGFSVNAPLKTLERAMEAANPGMTVYLLPGEYTEPLIVQTGGQNAAEPLRIRAYGKSPEVILRGGVTVAGLSHVVLEHLTLKNNPLTISNASGIKIDGCIVDTATGPAGLVTQSSDVMITAGAFLSAGDGLQLAESRDVSVIDSLFKCAGAAYRIDSESFKTFYSAYNVFDGFTARVAEEEFTEMAEWSRAFRWSGFDRAMPIRFEESYYLPSGSPLVQISSAYSYVGPRPELPAFRLEITDLAVKGKAPTAATVTWQTPREATEAVVELRDAASGELLQRVTPSYEFQIMGQVFDMTFRNQSFFTTDRWANVSGLKPGTRYRAVVIVKNVERTFENTAEIEFTTPRRESAPKLFYIAPGGDDDNDGLTPATAWASFRHAAYAVGPGDRVLIMPGRYRETLRPVISGTAENPVIFESAEPHAAIIDMQEQSGNGVEIVNANHIAIEGLQIAGGAWGVGGHNYIISNARGVRISGGRIAYPIYNRQLNLRSSFENLRMAKGGLVANNAPDLLVENNVFLCGYVGVAASLSPGARIVNNTIVGEGNFGVVIVPGAEDELYTVRNNLFYQTIMNYKTGAIIWMMNVKAQLDSDYNFFYIPEDHQANKGKLPDTERIRDLRQWQELTGLDLNSRRGKPKFIDPEGGDFRLQPGSPGIDADDDSGPVGARL